MPRSRKTAPRDVQILRSLVGVGKKVAATLLAEVSPALADLDYHALRAHAGVAPSTSRWSMVSKSIWVGSFHVVISGVEAPTETMPSIRTVLSRALFPVVTLLVVIGCNGASDTPPLDPVMPDAELAVQVANALHSPSPSVALARFQGELVRVFQEAESPAEADQIVRSSVLSAVRDTGDLGALDALSAAAGGQIYTTRFIRTAPPSPSGQAAQAGLCPTTEPPVVVYYMNGIGTTIFEALSDLHALQGAVGTLAPQDVDLEFRLFYNPSGWGTDTALCNSVGLALSRARLSDEEHARLLQLAHDMCDRKSVVEDLVPQAFAQWILQSVGYTVDPSFVSRYRDVVTQDIISGKKVIIVAHSQGNFYTRDLLRTLSQSVPPDGGAALGESVGVVSVASPVSYEAAVESSVGFYSLVQAREDVITWFHGAPAANTENALSLGVDEAMARAKVSIQPLVESILARSWPDSTVELVELYKKYRAVLDAALATHAFVRSYLDDPATRSLVESDTISAVTAAMNDRPISGQGFFQISLTWDLPGDIDLHVTEPDGTHVYFRNQTGTSGQLDRDDRVGTGPENYFVCAPEAVQPGSYKIQVNNYDGTTGTRADINIRAGSQFGRFGVTMDASNRGLDLIDVAAITYVNGSFVIGP